MAYCVISTFASFPRIKRPGRETDYFFRRDRECVGLYIHSLICLLGVVFNLLATDFFFSNFSTHCIKNVNNTETKQGSIMK